ncbi:bifunctional 4-hydroxy-2-oxoglutarate aldolase/2-dehydro-3-deoxy-phosphogluconate aldolase [Pseudorhodoplanes sp.]|jgi:2-dehydro-3-deoxyphosphogluconate aldolase/(4S)-4-hydroxy-2-oxoglutarate aldolase|uniref:bifunctional 4-hydroxy-2-oxoglutarate aldolase/2-dehydro-3-deoxy-phosphogluconate aldolase n=1 Tax=Pseudorhodoplanes sp. TaxID=1934341 RepID=UPI002CA67653|nr:bifunctional 4-hydroxy-2-oxoglutarate aldolase/2-dehydro-3-deoxy-phosphogluconate aldolase [Pseudorhodoplanes sp.]HWV43960.1 bifunctional 4-hydroxy-2-oxoglutarate aldolase/2-dehydro-3-deoxy-phosphogluconate aldolase [Pseudorhodoplanes sp.]
MPDAAETADLFSRAPVIPVLTIEDHESAVPLARALCDGGLPVLEVTLRTRAALAAIAAIAVEVPECIVGAGTVVRHVDAAFAIDAGAKFLVSPGTDSVLAETFTEIEIPVLPGCATVSEAMVLSDLGFDILKFFPAEASGGAAWLNAVAAPLPHIRFCPTGGIDQANAGDYLALPNVIAVGGSWVVPRDALAARDFARIRKLAQEAASLRG